MNVLSFDIETIPQDDAKLSDAQKEAIEKKVDSEISRACPNSDVDIHKIKSRIMGTSPYFGEIVVIGCYLVTPTYTRDHLFYGADEKTILTKFWEMLENFQGLFVSYNGLKFDVPFIIKRSMFYGILPTNKNFTDTRRFRTYPHFDAQEVISDYDRFMAPSLAVACDLLGITSPKEGEVKAENVAQAFKEGRVQEIANYCLRDVKATYKVYNAVKNYIQ